MRKRLLVASVVAGTALVMAMGAAPATAMGPPEVFEFEFEFGPVENPCTGEDHTLNITETLRVHTFVNDAGDRHHHNIRSSVEITTDDGYSGRGVFNDVHNHEGADDMPILEDEEGTGMVVRADNVMLSNRETGERIRFHSAEQIVVVNGVPKVDRFAFTLECLGRKGA
jgi:hypothetical protein